MESHVGSVYNPLYEAVFEALPCEIVVHDGECVVLANAAACHALGAISPRSLVGLPLSALMHPEDRASAEQRRFLVSGQERPFSPLTLRLTELSGDTFTIEATVRGFSIGERAFAVVTRTRYCPQIVEPAEDVLAFSEGMPLARATLDAVLQPITVYDSEDHFVFSNAAATLLFGGERADSLAGQPVSAVIHPHTLEAAQERRRLILDHGQSFPHIETKLQRLDGETLHAVGSLGSAKLPGGVRVGYWIGHSIADGPLLSAAG